MANLSKEVADRLKISRSVEHAFETRGEEVAERISKILFPDLVPDTLTPAQFVAALGGALARAGQTLEQADLAHAAELADDPAHRDARDQATGALIELLQRARSAIDAAYASDSSAKVGLAQRIPREPQALIQYARHVAGQLDEQTLGAPSDDLFPANLADLRARLNDAAKALAATLGDVERERREAQQTLERRDAARDEWARIYASVADIFVGLAGLAGLDELAARIKPTPRRRAGRTEPADEAPAEAEAESNEGEPSPET